MTETLGEGDLGVTESLYYSGGDAGNKNLCGG